MAFITTFECRHCHRKVEEIVTPSRICGNCRHEIAKANKDAYMAKLAAKPIEERVRCIELALYDLDGEARLKSIEARHQTYA